VTEQEKFAPAPRNGEGTLRLLVDGIDALVIALAGICALLSACYIARQDKFEEAVHTWIRIDMPFATAISILGTKGLTCTGGNPASCSRVRQGFQPYSCIEKVMVRFAGPNMLVDEIQIPKIGCAGL
jgi:hypothetical protein